MSCQCCANWWAQAEFGLRTVFGFQYGFLKEDSPDTLFRSNRVVTELPGGSALVEEYTYPSNTLQIDGVPEVDPPELTNSYFVGSGVPRPAAGGFSAQDTSDLEPDTRAALEGKEWQSAGGSGLTGLYQAFSGLVRVPFVIGYVPPGTNGAFTSATVNTFTAGQIRWRVTKGGHYTPVKLTWTEEAPQELSLSKADPGDVWNVIALPDGAGATTPFGSISLISPPWG